MKYLEEKGVPVRSFRNLKEEPLSVDEVRGLAAKVGGVEKLFSKRAMKYRNMGLHEQTLSEDDLLRLMSEEYTFVTRPVIVRGDHATAGFSASGWTSWWGEVPQRQHLQGLIGPGDREGETIDGRSSHLRRAAVDVIPTSGSSHGARRSPPSP